MCETRGAGSFYCGASFGGWCLAGGFLEWLCEIGITCLAALRSYTLFGLSGCVVKFSFLLTFSAKIVFVNKIITIVPLLYCSTKQFLSPTTSKTASVFWCGRCVWCGVGSSMSASVLYAIENQRLQSTTAKLHERASIQSGKKYQNSRNIKEKLAL